MINDLPVGRNPEEVLRLVQAFQFTGMCRPGSPYFFSNYYCTVTFGSPKSEVSLVISYTLVDVHGEVCPAAWTPGAKTMKADPVGSLDYFKSVS